MSGIANFIGTRVLSFQNPRVVCPPGTVTGNGRRNIIVATPRRSGTHVLIDLILNNMPEYRRRPLYVDLDQCLRRDGPGNDLMSHVRPGIGYVIKTHLPIYLDGAVTRDPRVLRLIEDAIVLTVRRDRDEVTRSMLRWEEPPQPASHHEALYDDFWRFWEKVPQVSLSFPDLFDAAAMKALLKQLGSMTGTKNETVFRPAPSPRGQGGIYLAKAMTRVLGPHAPLINTTIHTLKK
jgi:hypothetical protein